MFFNVKRFMRITRRVFARNERTHIRLTPKRLLVLLIFYTLFICIELFTWLGFWVDDMLFSAYKSVGVTQPVFIIGNPRSGTTFLHDLMAQDTHNFTCPRTWEILFAPSITQRKIIWALARFDTWLGSPLHRLLSWWEKENLSRFTMHRLSLQSPEEDEYLMIHLGSTIIGGLFFGLPDEAESFMRFDTDIDPQEQRTVMLFYRLCLQRHLYAHHSRRRILSKNPFYSAKVRALMRQFPGARFIYLVRNPLKVIPSYAKLYASWMEMLADPLEPYPYPEHVLDTTRYWYHYPLEQLEKGPADRYRVVKFNDLVKNPRETVRAIYQQFGLELTPDFDRILIEATEKSRRYRAGHSYSLDNMPFKREQIRAAYRDVFERWQFDPEES